MERFEAFYQAVEAEDIIRGIQCVKTYAESETLLEAFFRVGIFETMKAVDDFEDTGSAIWREHSRSEMIKLVIDNVRLEVEQYYLKNKKGSAPIVLTCPEGEIHELGAKVVSQLLRIKGFNAHFLGPNMPVDQVISFAETLNPVAVLFSVTNYYNLLTLKRSVEKLRERFPQLLLIVGGEPLKQNPEACPEARVVQDLDVLFDLVGGELR
jgi:methanogenic corrinoid protein MtbC1